MAQLLSGKKATSPRCLTSPSQLGGSSTILPTDNIIPQGCPSLSRDERINFNVKQCFVVPIKGEVPQKYLLCTYPFGDVVLALLLLCGSHAEGCLTET